MVTSLWPRDSIWHSKPNEVLTPKSPRAVPNCRIRCDCWPSECAAWQQKYKKEKTTGESRNKIDGTWKICKLKSPRRWWSDVPEIGGATPTNSTTLHNHHPHAAFRFPWGAGKACQRVPVSTHFAYAIWFQSHSISLYAICLASLPQVVSHSAVHVMWLEISYAKCN